MDPMRSARATDPEIAGIIRREVERQNTTIQLIASENFTSPAVLEAQGSVLTNKYSEGYPAKRYYGGNYVVDDAEDLARDRACELFGAEHANVQPHSGANANMAAFLALLEPGDKVMGMRLDQGGHLTHGSPVNFSGRIYDFVAYGVDDDTETLDYDEIRELARSRAAQADRRRRDRLSRASSTSRPSARSPTRSARCSWSTPPTSPASSPAARTRRRRRTPTSSRSPRTRRCAGRGRRDPVPRAVRGRDRQGGVPRTAGRPAHARDRGQGGRLPRGGAARRSATTRPGSCATRVRWPTASRARASASCRAAPTTT